MNVTSPLSVADAVTLTRRRFLIEKANLNVPSPVYAQAAADYVYALERYPATMAVAAALLAQSADSTTLDALDINTFPNG